MPARDPRPGAGPKVIMLAAPARPGDACHEELSWFSPIVMMPGGGLPPGWGTCGVSPSWCSACRGAACRSRSRWRGRLAHRWMSSWCASSGCRSSPSWAWARSGRTGCGSSTPRSLTWPGYRRTCSRPSRCGSRPRWTPAPGGTGWRGRASRCVAGVLNEAGLSTLLFDLLTPEEEADRANVFDIGLLAGRLAEVTGWLRAQPRAARAAVGYFGASTGAAAALWAAAEPGAGIAAVVSRGGRPDLARPRLAAVTAPTLLIVGGRDEVVLDLNRRAQAELRCQNGLAVVPGATHLFQEPGTLDAAAGLARDWFLSHLTQ